MGQLTAATLRKFLHYDPQTGVFTRLVTTSHNAKVGDVAGSANHGYLFISVAGRRRAAHRLAWLYMTGRWPKPEVDHRDTNGQNNRWGNLRESTKSANEANKRKRLDNTSGRKGVHWHKKSGKWRVQIAVNRRRIQIGMFQSVDDAAEAYRVAALTYFGEFARAA